MSSAETILIIDDDTVSLDILAKKLTKHGYRCLTLASGEKALSTIREQKAKLVILDIIMPGLSGMDVLQQLREEYQPTELPIIMASVRDDTEDIVKALHLGANDYLVKPVDIEIALTRIKTQLEIARLSQEVSLKHKDKNNVIDLPSKSQASGHERTSAQKKRAGG